MEGRRAVAGLIAVAVTACGAAPAPASIEAPRPCAFVAAGSAIAETRLGLAPGSRIERVPSLLDDSSLPLNEAFRATLARVDGGETLVVGLEEVGESATVLFLVPEEGGYCVLGGWGQDFGGNGITLDGPVITAIPAGRAIVIGTHAYFHGDGGGELPGWVVLVASDERVVVARTGEGECGEVGAQSECERMAETEADADACDDVVEAACEPPTVEIDASGAVTLSDSERRTLDPVTLTFRGGTP